MTHSLKKDQRKIRYFKLYQDIIMAEKGIRGGICHAIHQYTKANNKYIKHDVKNKESS